ncbi:SIP domain-containing protein [uncultured Microbacterium sp.]|uniref:SIP domain-containing protein n=1 Tax=uncultured Microbacterium sp. TaxID=191216 RepID=UPI0025D08241|nr:SIP domain-containing protein [uncultured Microbacterium sp.]
MTTAIRTTARAERRATRRSAKAQHLIVADELSLPELEAALVALPLCATGRVFVEVPEAENASHLSVPPRMTVTWLSRSSRSGAPGTSRRCIAGQAAARAAIAWADEMLCDGAEEHTRVTLLGGYLGTADIAEHLVERLGVSPAQISAPDRFGLFA